MRLIDADALMNERGMCEDCDNCKHDSRLCRYNQDYSRMDICEMLTDAPTIAAIPVEWLKKMRKDDRLTIDDVETIDLILIWWQKEQEAR